MADDLGRNLSRLGRYAAADKVDDAVLGSGGCVGRLFGCVLLLLFLIVFGIMAGIGYVLKTILPGSEALAGKVMGFFMVVGLIGAIVVIGVFHNTLRRWFWRTFLRG